MTDDLFDFHGGAVARRELGVEQLVPAAAMAAIHADNQRAVPAIARDLALSTLVEEAAARVPTTQRLVNGDARHLAGLPDESVHLVVTSPPYWTLKEYEDGEGQLGYVEDYEEFNDELATVWRECLRVLVPGGRLVVNVGDVCLPRRSKLGRHVVYPLHATITERCRDIGFDNLTPILWHKIANAKYEAGGGAFLGKPYEPNAVIKNDIEWILFQRKQGYRKPDLPTRALSLIPAHKHREWFQNFWTMTGASTKAHPAPYPVELASRLVRMFSFVGDTVLDPFSGTGTTSVAAASCGRDSIGIEVQPTYHAMAVERLGALREAASVAPPAELPTAPPEAAGAA